MRDVAKDLADVLQASGLSLTEGDSLYVGQLWPEDDPDTPDKCVAVLQTGGAPPSAFIGGGQKADRFVTCQVRVRGDREEFLVGQSLALACSSALNQIAPSPYTSITVRESSPLFLGADKADRPAWSFNVEARYRDDGTAPPALDLEDGTWLAEDVTVEPTVLGTDNVQDALEALEAEIAGISLTASAVAVTPSGNLGSTNVQAALVELQGDADALDTRADALEAADTALDARVDALEAADVAMDVRVDALEAADVAFDTRADALEAADVALDSRLDAIEAVVGPVTTAALTFYVATTGSDSNDGLTALTPLATVKAALRKVPRGLRHPVVVSIAAGTYAQGAYISGFYSDPDDPANGAYLELRGAMAQATVATGSATGTLTGSAAGSPTSTPVTHGTATDSGQSWTTDDLRGKFLEITSGTQSGALIPIATNTATVITVAGTWTAPAIGSTYRIVEPGAIFTGTVADVDPSGLSIPSAPAADGGAHTFWCSSISGADRPIVFSYLKVNATNCIAACDGSVRIDYCTIQPSSNGGRGVTLLSFAHAVSRRSILNCSAGASTVSVGTMADLVIVNNPQSHNVGWTSQNSLFYTSANAAHIAIPIPCTVISNRDAFYGGYAAVNTWSHSTTNMFACKLSGIAHGIYSNPLTNVPPSVGAEFVLQNVDMSSCTTACDLAGAANVFMFNVTGSSNTTAIKMLNGTRVTISSNVSLTGTTEIDLDGTAFTLAALRALTEKSIVNLDSLSRIWEQ